MGSIMKQNENAAKMKSLESDIIIRKHKHQKDLLLAEIETLFELTDYFDVSNFIVNKYTEYKS